ncbi:hypothetical protein M2163_000036 [Streptomyces sp. SAI-135]|uniref:hypothetical protein n=1 Tax=unclassified Streptomyces TaxID=2593676 RepID=UPI0024741C77|nr:MULTISPECIES: hypothetical protein [unclassified Streptomyces]MDH6523459.1 hypothetical protein [Streptomyces sp. SAI-090]MDH6555080.1 hypothetical protein [Streptomyces sp. SAI-041]MDH6574352.1 hypothetical protein [Streptomyces sp. SAI-117]MDH6580924.1 hypothetical protein [Streptomyces sp. SAI-133]MDH6612928.1 hypothetical protein [Streptomyces sp. SAI-135]
MPKGTVVDLSSPAAAPASTAADLVVVQVAFLFRALEALLDRPPVARDTDELVQRSAGGPDEVFRMSF